MFLQICWHHFFSKISRSCKKFDRIRFKVENIVWETGVLLQLRRDSLQLPTTMTTTTITTMATMTSMTATTSKPMQS